MSLTIRGVLTYLSWLPYAIAVVAWVNVVGLQTITYSSRLSGFDSAAPADAPLQGLACPPYAIETVVARADIPEPVSPPVIYITYFSIIPADVSRSFQYLCSKLAIGTPPQPAQAACQFDIASLESRDSGSWFLRVIARERLEDGTPAEDGYGGTCLIRTRDVWTQDATFAAIAAVTALALMVIGIFLWPRGGTAWKIAVVLAVPLVWYITSVALSLSLIGYIDLTFFVISALLIVVIMVLRESLAGRQKSVA